MRQSLDVHFAPGQRIGLLGGSFNPAHEGHLEISLIALRLLHLHRVVWMVSPQNPLKPVEEMAALETRVASARALTRHRNVIVSKVEAQLGTRYTVDTIRAMKQRFPGVRFVLLLGADNLLQLPRWRRWTNIVDEVPMAVFARPGSTLKAPFSQAAQRYRRARIALSIAKSLPWMEPPAWVYVPYTALRQSSTQLRAARAWPS